MLYPRSTLPHRRRVQCDVGVAGGRQRRRPAQVGAGQRLRLGRDLRHLLEALPVGGRLQVQRLVRERRPVGPGPLGRGQEGQGERLRGVVARHQAGARRQGPDRPRRLVGVDGGAARLQSGRLVGGAPQAPQIIPPTGRGLGASQPARPCKAPRPRRV